MAPPGAMAALIGYGQPKAPDPLWITTYLVTGTADITASVNTVNAYGLRLRLRSMLTADDDTGEAH